MTLRHTLALLLLATSPALAQAPGAKAPAPASATPDDMAEFDKELDALFPGKGLTADEAAQRALRTSPTVDRAVADVEVAIAEAKAAEVARIPVIGIEGKYTRLSRVDLPPLSFGGMSFTSRTFSLTPVLFDKIINLLTRQLGGQYTRFIWGDSILQFRVHCCYLPVLCVVFYLYCSRTSCVYIGQVFPFSVNLAVVPDN